MNLDLDTIYAFDNLVVFKRRNKLHGGKDKAACEHGGVIIDEALNELECEDCGQKVNPIWWLSRHMPKMTYQYERAAERHAKAIEMESTLRRMSRYICKHCGEVEDFKLGTFTAKKHIAHCLEILKAEDLAHAKECDK